MPDIEQMPDNDGLMMILDAMKYERGERNANLRISYVRGALGELMTLRTRVKELEAMLPKQLAE